MTEKLRPYRPVTPGEILKEELDARGWTQTDFAEILGRPIQAINEIISGKKAVVPATAVELSRAMGNSPEFWLNLESAYRLDLLHHEGKNNEQIARRAKVYSLVPVKEIAKKGWIKKSQNLDIIEREVCRLLEIESVDEKPVLAVAARKSDPYGALSPGQVAWVCRARQIARRKKVNPFDRRKFNAQVGSLAELSVDDAGVAQLPKALANLGVRLVVVDTVAVEGQRRIAEQQDRVGLDGAAPERFARRGNGRRQRLARLPLGAEGDVLLLFDGQALFP